MIPTLLEITKRDRDALARANQRRLREEIATYENYQRQGLLRPAGPRHLRRLQRLLAERLASREETSVVWWCT